MEVGPLLSVEVDAESQHRRKGATCSIRSDKEPDYPRDLVDQPGYLMQCRSVWILADVIIENDGRSINRTWWAMVPVATFDFESGLS